MSRYRFWFFATGAALALAISAPNTYQIASPLHAGDGGIVGIVLTVAFVILLEAGAVGAEVAGVSWLCFGLLALTFVANCAIGSTSLDRANLDAMPSLLAWRASGYGWLLVLCYAAVVPILLYTFLHYALAALHTTAQEPAPPAHDVALVSALVAIVDRLPALPAPVPAQEVFARPEEQRTQPVLTGDLRCMGDEGCGALVTSHQRRAYAQRPVFVCKQCGKRHDHTTTR